jgi:two-component system chemotaxis response regulator CheY
MIDNKVLFVDDSPTMRRIIKNSLQKIGFNELIEAENGVDALEKIDGEDVGLILSDWNMPEMNGKQLVEALKADDKYKDIPIIMITTRGMKEDVITAVKLGVAGYVVKPFTPDILKGKIQKALAK